MYGVKLRLLRQEMSEAKYRAQREELRKRARSGEKPVPGLSEIEVEGSFIFDPMDAESVAQEANLVCVCLDAIRTDGEGWCSVSMQWRECLPKGTLECAEPQLVAYLEVWEQADARDEAYMLGGLAVGDRVFPPTVWERRAEAAGRCVRRRTMGQMLSSLLSLSSSSDEDEGSYGEFSLLLLHHGDCCQRYARARGST
jgi:hypothetical protein